jgi:hypothetical protein
MTGAPSEVEEVLVVVLVVEVVLLVEVVLVVYEGNGLPERRQF